MVWCGPNAIKSEGKFELPASRTFEPSDVVAMAGTLYVPR